MAFAGDSVECPCCGGRFRFFRAMNDPNRICWACGAMERHRSAWIYLDGHPELLPAGVKVLHIAPEFMLGRRLASVPGATYTSGDLEAEFGPERIDVTGMQFADGAFDAVVCNHVLEHVPDDRAAMREIFRVLRPGGWALLQVPDLDDDVTHEDATVTDPAERERIFGQEDHVRRYGWDYLTRLREAGFETEAWLADEHLPPADIERYRLRRPSGKLEPVIIGRKAADANAAR
jgi:SAM-dependent methyltransferase